MTEGEELVELVAVESETIVPSHCQVTRWPDGQLYAEIWIKESFCEFDSNDVWQYAITKLR